MPKGKLEVTFTSSSPGQSLPADELRSHSPLTKGGTGKLANHAHPYARVPIASPEKDRLARWPVRAGRLAGEAKCQGQQRQLKEAAARERWLQELQQLLSRAQLPAAAGGSSVRDGKGPPGFHP